MNYLITGASLIAIFLLLQCNSERVEKSYKLKLVYENQTDHHLKYQKIHPITLESTILFEIEANSSFEWDDLGYKNGQQFLDDIGYPTQIIFDAVKCVTIDEGTGPNNFVNFTKTGITEFSYTFTESDYQEADDCP